MDSPTSIMSMERPGKTLVVCERRRERLAFADRAGGPFESALEQQRPDRLGGGFKRLQQRNAADQQRAEDARKLRDLVFDPDLAEDGRAQFDRGRCFSRPEGAPAHRRNRKNASDQRTGEQQDVTARGGADGDQDLRHRRQVGLHAGVQLGEVRHDVGDQEDDQA